jgi:hypothetical protein
MMIFFVKLSLKSNVRGLPLLLEKCCSILLPCNTTVADTNVTMLTIPKGIAIVMQEHCRRQCDGVDLCTANNNDYLIAW